MRRARAISRTATIAAPRIGTSNPSRPSVTEPTSSPVASTGFPTPAVIAEDFRRNRAVPTCTNPAAPPPARTTDVHPLRGEEAGGGGGGGGGGRGPGRERPA